MNFLRTCRLSLLNTSSKRFLSTVPEATTQTIDLKYRNPRKKASKIYSELFNETFKETKGARDLDKFLVGDAIEVAKKPYMTSTETELFHGVVVAKVNKGADTTIRTVNAEGRMPIYRQFKLYSPMILNVRVLKQAFIHHGRKRVRRSKLYYLEKRNMEQFWIRDELINQDKKESKKKA